MGKGGIRLDPERQPRATTGGELQNPLDRLDNAAFPKAEPLTTNEGPTTTLRDASAADTSEAPGDRLTKQSGPDAGDTTRTQALAGSAYASHDGGQMEDKIRLVPRPDDVTATSTSDLSKRNEKAAAADKDVDIVKASQRPPGTGAWGLPASATSAKSGGAGQDIGKDVAAGGQRHGEGRPAKQQEVHGSLQRGSPKGAKGKLGAAGTATSRSGAPQQPSTASAAVDESGTSGLTGQVGDKGRFGQQQQQQESPSKSEDSRHRQAGRSIETPSENDYTYGHTLAEDELPSQTKKTYGKFGVDIDLPSTQIGHELLTDEDEEPLDDDDSAAQPSRAKAPSTKKATPPQGRKPAGGRSRGHEEDDKTAVDQLSSRTRPGDVDRSQLPSQSDVIFGSYGVPLDLPSTQIGHELLTDEDEGPLDDDDDDDVEDADTAKTAGVDRVDSGGARGVPRPSKKKERRPPADEPPKEPPKEPATAAAASASGSKAAGARRGVGAIVAGPKEARLQSPSLRGHMTDADDRIKRSIERTWPDKQAPEAKTQQGQHKTTPEARAKTQHKTTPDAKHDDTERGDDVKQDVGRHVGQESQGGTTLKGGLGRQHEFGAQHGGKHGIQVIAHDVEQDDAHESQTVAHSALKNDTQPSVKEFAKRHSKRDVSEHAEQQDAAQHPAQRVDKRGPSKHETGKHETGKHDIGKHETGKHDTSKHETGKHDTRLGGSKHDNDTGDDAGDVVGASGTKASGKSSKAKAQPSEEDAQKQVEKAQPDVAKSGAATKSESKVDERAFASYESTVAHLRSTFRSFRTLPERWRMEQLGRLKQGISDHLQDIYNALKEDLGKSEFETYSHEVGLSLQEIEYFETNLYALMQRELVVTPMIQMPSLGYIQPQPFGVVLISSPWNYPFNLAIIPLIGAIAAGMLSLHIDVPHGHQTQAAGIGTE